MPRIELTAEAIARELTDFERRVAAGITVLRELGELRPGATPRAQVWRRDGVVLYRYGGEAATGAPPLLIVYALVNRPDMVDLERGRSLVAALLARGFDVYLVDWGYPSGAERLRGLDDYVNDYLDACVDRVRERSGRAAVPLLGICQGGTLGACYAALHPEKVSHLIATVTPIDFHTPDDMLSHLVRHIDLEALVASLGNVGGDVLNGLFLSLKPYRLMQQKYLRFLRRLDDRAHTAMFLRMEQWIFDSPALTARACREYGRDFYQLNRLVTGGLRLGARPVALAALTMPVLNIYASDDHLVPPASSQALGALVGTGDYTEAEIKGGHIGIYVAVRAERSVPALVAEWLAARAQEKKPRAGAVGRGTRTRRGEVNR